MEDIVNLCKHRGFIFPSSAERCTVERSSKQQVELRDCARDGRKEGDHGVGAVERRGLRDTRETTRAKLKPWHRLDQRFKVLCRAERYAVTSSQRSGRERRERLDVATRPN